MSRCYTVVASAVEFQLTTACDWKLPPVTARVKAEEPAGTVAGDMFAMTGAGARDGAPLPEPPEQPESVTAAKKIEERQRDARRRGEGVRRVIGNGQKTFSGNVSLITAFPKWRLEHAYRGGHV